MKAIKSPLFEILRRTAWYDCLLLIFLTAVVRQFFWGIESQHLAWGLSALLGAVITVAHIANREGFEASPGPLFWLVVALPLCAFFALRLPFPDMNFDQVNYHLVNTERAMRGWPFHAGDFFPGVLLVNPAPDMAAGIARYFLGYRLGTVINLLAILWAAQVVDRFMRHFINRAWLRALAVLFAVSTEHLLFLLNLYMIDLLALPLLLEALYLAWRFGHLDRKNYSVIHIALFAGVSLAFKLTNLAFVLPLLGVTALQIYKTREQIRRRTCLWAALLLGLPILPFSIYMYLQTGNPVFPYYNQVFRSPLFPLRGYRDMDHGPRNFIETLIWPLWGIIESGRISAMTGLYIYKGKITFAFVASIIGICYRRAIEGTRLLCGFALCAVFLWSVASGDIRYGIAIEMCGGIMAAAILASAVHIELNDSGHNSLKLAFACTLFGLALVAQTAFIYAQAIQHKEYLSTEQTYDFVSQRTIFSDPAAYARESRNILRDYSEQPFLNPSLKAQLDLVDVWINSFDATSGIEAALKPEAPMISVCSFLNLFDYDDSADFRQRRAAAIDKVRGKRIYSLVGRTNLGAALKFIDRADLVAREISPVEVPFYSVTTKADLVLIRLEPLDKARLGEPTR
jgi:hypothetical protein